VRHPDRDDDVRSCVEHRAAFLSPSAGTPRPILAGLLEEPGVAARAVRVWVEVGLAARHSDRLPRCSGAIPATSGAPDELLDVPRPLSPVEIADTEGDDLRLLGRRHLGRRQERGARERRDERTAHRWSSDHVWSSPPRWTGLVTGSAPGSSGHAEPARGRSWVLDHLLEFEHRVTYRRARTAAPCSPRPRASAIHGTWRKTRSEGERNGTERPFASERTYQWPPTTM